MQTHVSQPEAKAGPTPPVPRYSYYALSILTLVNFLNYIDRQVFPAVAPLMKRDLNITDTHIGAMDASLLVSFTVLAPLFGLLGDRMSRTKLMASAAVIWSLATALTGYADALPLVSIPIAFCIARAIVGVGESSYTTITPGLIADYFVPRMRATALGIFQAAIPMGFALGFVIGGQLGAFVGWRRAFMIVSIPGMLTAVTVWRLREPARGATDAVPPSASDSSASDAQTNTFAAWRRTILSILTNRDWLLSTAGYAGLTAVLGAFALWATFLLNQDKGMSLEHATAALGVIILVAGAIGTFGGGWVADRLARKRKNAYFLVCGISSLLGIAPTVLVLTSHNQVLYLGGIFLAVLFLFVNNAPFHAILVGSVSPLVRATAVALNIVTIHMLGDVPTRIGVGYLSENFQQGRFSGLRAVAGLLGIDAVRDHYSAALLITPFALICSAALFLFGAFLHRGKNAS